MRFKLRRSAVKAGLKPLSGRCKRNTPTSLAAANRSFAAPISVLQASTIGLLSVPLRRRKRPQSCAADYKLLAAIALSRKTDVSPAGGPPRVA